MSEEGDNSRDARIRELFIKASELETKEEREDFLEQACAEDPQLLEEVTSLLSAHEKSNSLMEMDLLGEVEDKMNGIIGSRIGRYHVLEKLGEGGFGEVYRVEQTEPIQRELALKIIKPGMDSRDVIRRFEGERQALARLDHPNIAHIVDAGATESGRPYFVMELARGEPITQYCDRYGLSIDERLKLFRQVCHGVQHAHQNGIIHRDLNPANIVITKKEGPPVPKIIDFGIAKSLQGHLTGKTVLTQRQILVGTPEYMSPEQFTRSSSDLDHRTDIYSLGSVLYELVSGSPPVNSETMRKAGISEIPRIITEDEPVKPSTRLRTVSDTKAIAEKRGTTHSRLDHKLRGDLDRIIMKCLEKDRIRRYESADGLDQDLKAFLECRPVKATAPSVSYRIQKLIRRNRQTFLAYTAACAILVAVLAILSAIRSRDSIPPEFDEIQKSIALLPFDNRSKLQDDAYFTDGIHDDLLTHISRIKDIRTISRTSVMAYKGTTKNLKTIGEELGVATILEGGVQRAGNMIRVNAQLMDAATDAQLWAYTYDKEVTVENILRTQSEIALAIADALKAVLSPEEEQDLQVLPTQNLAALEAYFKGLVLTRAMDNMKSREFLQEAILLDPGFADAYALLGYRIIEQESSMHYPIEDLIPQAEPLFEKALELDPRNGRTYVGIGRMHMLNGDIEAAEKAFQRAIDLSPSDSEPYIYYSFLLHYHLRKPDLALKIISRGLKVDPKREDLRTSYIYVLTKLKRFDEALSAYEQFNKDFPDASSSHVLSNFFKEQGKYDQALRVMRAVYYEDPANFGHAKRVRILYSLLGDVESATFWRTRCKELDPTVNVSLDDKVYELIASENWQEVERFFKSNFSPANAKMGEDNRPWKVKDIAYSLLASGQTEIAKDILQQMIRYTKERKDMELLVRLYSLAGDSKSAIEIIKENPMEWAAAYNQPDLENLRGHPEYEALMKEPLLQLERQRRRVAEWEANGLLAPIPPLPLK